MEPYNWKDGKVQIKRNGQSIVITDAFLISETLDEGWNYIDGNWIIAKSKKEIETKTLKDLIEDK